MTVNAIAGSLTAPTLTRRSGIACPKCGEGRPASHLRCYVCGRRLANQDEHFGWAHNLVASRPATAARWLFRRIRAAHAPALGAPRVELRTAGDRLARWYAYASVAAVSLWLVASPGHAVPAAAQSPSEACAWLDSQRTHLVDETLRATEGQRASVAQYLTALAAAVGDRVRPA